MNCPPQEDAALKIALPAVMVVVAIFFMNFMSRMTFAPLMPLLQEQYGFSHVGAGNVFLMMAIGNAVGLVFNGLLSRMITHRRTVGVSAVMVGLAVMVIPLATHYATLLVLVLVMGVAVGLYLPSGIATVTSLVRKQDWGMALAVHELAPNSAFVFAPVLAEVVLLFLSWESVFWLVGGAQVVMGLCFLRWGKGGESLGTVPTPQVIWRVVRRPVFWVLALCMCVGVGASVGPYSMLPLYLADVHGLGREEANQLMSVSRIAAVFGPFFAGWVTDMWGAKRAIAMYLFLNGAALIGVGLASGNALLVMVLCQPVFSVFLFAPGFTLLSLALPPELRTVAIGLVGPLNAIVGLGLTPVFLGWMGDVGLFHVGFMLLGVTLLSLLFLLPFLPDGKNASS